MKKPCKKPIKSDLLFGLVARKILHLHKFLIYIISKFSQQWLM